MVGVQGSRGVNGSKGDDGDKGIPGENTQGPPGPAGPPGTETEKEVLMTMLTRALFSHSMYALSNKIRSFLCTKNSQTAYVSNVFQTETQIPKKPN